MIGLQEKQKVRRRTPIGVALEGLETRTVLSATVSHAVHSHAVEVVTAAATSTSTAGTIQGQITNSTTGRPMARVRVELINGSGVVVQTTRTGGHGFYTFHPRKAGAYVVHEVTPRGFVQTSPTFVFNEPTGDFAPGFGPSSWNYRTGNDNPANGPVGPPHWNTIAPAGNRPFESPINLTGPTVDLDRYLAVNYAPAVPSAIVNNGAQIQTQFTASATDTVALNGQVFALQQFHFHDTAENTLNGRVFPMEVHFVNTSASGAETVVGVFVELGAHNVAFDPILSAATAQLGQPNTSTPGTTSVDFARLLPANKQGYFFQGTLTTPPLSGPINWFVYATPITIDYAQLKQYEAVADASGFLPNNRPVQPLDGRQLNEFTANVDFAGGKVAGVDFAIARKTTT